MLAMLFMVRVISVSLLAQVAESSDGQEVSTEVTPVPPFSYAVQGLKHSTNYSVRVQCSNEMGSSPFTDRVYFQTLELGKKQQKEQDSSSEPEKEMIINVINSSLILQYRKCYAVRLLVHSEGLLEQNKNMHSNVLNSNVICIIQELFQPYGFCMLVPLALGILGILGEMRGGFSTWNSRVLMACRSCSLPLHPLFSGWSQERGRNCHFQCG